MSNARFNKQTSGGERAEPGAPPPTGARGKRASDAPEKAVGFAGVPGKTQPRNRSGGTPRGKFHIRSEGL